MIRIRTTHFLRTYINNNLTIFINKIKCEICGTTECLQLHHDNQHYFNDILTQALYILGLENKIYIDEYSDKEKDILSNYVLGKHVSLPYQILCKRCHSEYHKRNGYFTEKRLCKKYRKQITYYKEHYGNDNLDTILRDFNYKYLNDLCKKYINKKLYKDNEEQKLFKIEFFENIILPKDIDTRKKGIRCINFILNRNKIPYFVISKKDKTAKNRDKTYWIMKSTS